MICINRLGADKTSLGDDLNNQTRSVDSNMPCVGSDRQISKCNRKQKKIRKDKRITFISTDTLIAKVTDGNKGLLKSVLVLAGDEVASAGDESFAIQTRSPVI